MRVSQNDGQGYQELHQASGEAFVDAIREKTTSTARFKTFKFVNYVISTVDINKACLSLLDTKRYILPDGISTFAYGHYRLR